VDVRCFSCVEFDCVEEVVLGVSGCFAELVELDVGDFSGLSVELVVGAAFFVQYEFDLVSDLER